MIRRVLIANRGEIALRVQRTCRELGLETVAVYSEPDREALHVRQADAAVGIGPGPSAESYLAIDKILEAARATGADAVHPGYGFLSERPAFALACERAGLVFIGPPVAALEAMGDKVAARRLMERAGVPVVPGAHDIRPGDLPGTLREAERIGFPLLVKAAAGGGGRGIRLVRGADELEGAMRAGVQEAEAAFGDGTIFLERYVERSRHVEVQVMGDAHGTVYAYGERECSVQRRHQKLVEEAPSVAVSPELRALMCEAAVAAARSCGYRNAGTVEFLLDDRRGEFFFMEMNARLQVEHPVTELVYGVDLVALQIAVANGERLPPIAQPPVPRGWAIECRINGEDPYQGFLPVVGVVEHMQPPLGPGTRFDSMLFDGLDIPVFYDSMLGKLIVWAEDRPRAIQRMRLALRDLVVAGVQTNIPFHLALMEHPDYVQGRVYTSWLEERFAMPSAEADAATERDALIAAVVAMDRARPEPADSGGAPASGWRAAARARAVARRAGAGGTTGWRRGSASS